VKLPLEPPSLQRFWKIHEKMDRNFGIFWRFGSYFLTLGISKVLDSNFEEVYGKEGCKK